MPTIIRKYSTSDVAMLTAASTIVENAIAQQAKLVAKRAAWADPFFPNFSTRIDDAVKTFIGVDGAKNLRKATDTLQAIEANALDKLSW